MHSPLPSPLSHCPRQYWSNWPCKAGQTVLLACRILPLPIVRHFKQGCPDKPSQRLSVTRRQLVRISTTRFSEASKPRIWQTSLVTGQLLLRERRLGLGCSELCYYSAGPKQNQYMAAVWHFCFASSGASKPEACCCLLEALQIAAGMLLRPGTYATNTCRPNCDVYLPNAVDPHLACERGLLEDQGALGALRIFGYRYRLTATNAAGFCSRRRPCMGSRVAGTRYTQEAKQRLRPVEAIS